MQWVSVAGPQVDLDSAVAHAGAAVQAALDGPPDLLLAFIGREHRRRYDEVPALVAAHTGGRVVGCSAAGVVAGRREFERGPAIVLTAARLPAVRVVTRWLAPGAVPDVEAPPATWQRLLDVSPADAPLFLVLADPYTCPAEHLVAGLAGAFPGAPVLGGLASGMHGPGGGALYANGDTMRAGAVCVALCGDIAVDTAVAQGCRPIGDPMFVTRARGGDLLELDGRRPLDVVGDLFSRLDDADRELFRHSLFIGVAMQPGEPGYRQGDFLIRNLAGADPDAGTLSVGAALQPRQVVQFHLRDAQASARDLDLVLARLAHARAAPAAGALMFTCTGRGQGLYGSADHDASAFGQRFGDVPLGGFFGNGEIGPVGGTPFLHGYTSVFGLFRPRSGG